jgi:hypothetical protein
VHKNVFLLALAAKTFLSAEAAEALCFTSKFLPHNLLQNLGNTSAIIFCYTVDIDVVNEMKVGCYVVNELEVS